MSTLSKKSVAEVTGPVQSKDDMVDKPSGFIGQSRDDSLNYDKYLERLKIRKQLLQKDMGLSENEKAIVGYTTEFEKLVDSYLPTVYKMAEAGPGEAGNLYYKYKYYESLAGSSHPYDIAVELAKNASKIKEFKSNEEVVLSDMPEDIKKKVQAGKNTKSP